jgi:hypothetical protein
MRGLALASALLACLAFPAVQAAVVEDGAGDVQVGVNGAGSAADPTPAHACVDLRALDVAEEGERLRFTVTVSDVSNPPEESPDGCAWAVLFRHGGREFQLYMTRVAEVNSYQPYASLGYRDGADGPWSPIWRTTGKVEFDVAAETLTILVPRAELVDSEGNLPYAGRSLEDIHANSASRMSGDLTMGYGLSPIPSPVFAADRMPDGDGQGSYAVMDAAPAGKPVDGEAAAAGGVEASSARESPSSGLALLGLAVALALLVRRR